MRATNKPLDYCRRTEGRLVLAHEHNRRRLIALGIALPTVVLVGWLILKFGGGAFLNAVGVAIPGFVGLVIGAVLFVLALFWAVCLLLLPIYVYFIHRTLLKIEQNTRSK